MAIINGGRDPHQARRSFRKLEVATDASEEFSVMRISPAAKRDVSEE